MTAPNPLYKYTNKRSGRPPQGSFHLYPAYAVTCPAGFVLAVARSGLGEDVATWSNLAGHLAFWHYDFPFATHGAELTIVL